MFPQKPKPDENCPMPNNLKILPMSRSEKIADRIAPVKLPKATTSKKRKANDNRNLFDEMPKLLYIAILPVSVCNNLLAESQTATKINIAATI